MAESAVTIIMDRVIKTLVELDQLLRINGGKTIMELGKVSEEGGSNLPSPDDGLKQLIRSIV